MALRQREDLSRLHVNFLHGRDLLGRVDLGRVRRLHVFALKDRDLACLVLDAVLDTETKDGSRRLALVVDVQGKFDVWWVPHTTRFHLLIFQFITDTSKIA